MICNIQIHELHFMRRNLIKDYRNTGKSRQCLRRLKYSRNVGNSRGPRRRLNLFRASIAESKFEVWGVLIETIGRRVVE